MERTKKVETRPDGRVMWIKRGGGSLRILGKIIKPNEKFLAMEEDIPKAFRDVVVPVDEASLVSTKPAVKPRISTYSVRAAKDGLFNVVNQNGKIITDAPLSEQEALKIAEELKSK